MKGVLERWAPGLVTLRSYERGWLRSDLVAGVVLAAILVPQGMAYAELAGLPAVTGLYTTIACLVAYAVFGPSKVLVLGPDSSVSPLILVAITPLIVTSDPSSAIALAGMLAILVGLIEIGLGVAKLGFVADLLSSEVRVGYLNGLAITIIVGQLPKLFGFSTSADNFIDEVRAFFDGLSQTKLGIHLAFVELRDRLQDLVRRYGLHTTLDQEHIYPSLDQALNAITNAASSDARNRPVRPVESGGSPQ